MERLRPLPIRWAYVMIGVLVATAISATVYRHVHSYVGRSGTVAISMSGDPNAPAGFSQRACSNPNVVAFAGHTWLSEGWAYAAWGQGAETGTFRVTSKTEAVFVSDADHRRMPFERLDPRMSSLSCTADWR